MIDEPAENVEATFFRSLLAIFKQYLLGSSEKQEKGLPNLL